MTQPTVDDCRVTGFILPGQSGNYRIDTGVWFGERYTYLVEANDPELWELMDDSSETLSFYEDFLAVVTGDVLLCGLGLGCLIRGLLTCDHVTSIDVMELEQDIIDLVGPYYQDPRVNIVQGDGMTYEWPEGKRWNTAFFDAFPNVAQLSKNYSTIEERFWLRVDQLGCFARPKHEDGNVMIQVGNP